jgi:hypothetical protein
MAEKEGRKKKKEGRKRKEEGKLKLPGPLRKEAKKREGDGAAGGARWDVARLARWGGSPDVPIVARQIRRSEKYNIIFIFKIFKIYK